MKIDFQQNAWFLPGKIHDHPKQVYRIYANYDSSTPSWEVQPILAEQILKAYQEAERAPIEECYDWFEEALSADCQGQWGWAPMESEYGHEIAEAYQTADFYGCSDVLPELITWAKSKINEMDFEKDAWFFPGKIHGCADQVYRIYANYDSEVPSWEVQPIWAEQVIQAFDVATQAPTDQRYEQFEETLCELCQGQWGYTEMNSEYGEELKESFVDADCYGFPEIPPELIEWAKSRVTKKTEAMVKTIFDLR